MLKTILCVQHFCSFGATLFVSLLIKTDSSVICVLCMLEHVCYEPFSLKNCRIERYLMLKLLTHVRISVRCFFKGRPILSFSVVISFSTFFIFIIRST